MTENTTAVAARRRDATPATLTDPPMPPLHPLAVAIDSIDWTMDGAMDWELLARQN